MGIPRPLAVHDKGSLLQIRRDEIDHHLAPLPDQLWIAEAVT
jgi:hypothetical protein